MNALPSHQKTPWSTNHPITAEDKVAIAALRAVVEPLKGKLQGTAARAPFDAIMERVSAPAAVSFEADIVGGIRGWWCRPSQARSGHVVLHLHGGWFNWGSAQAFRHFVGHIAASAGASAFIPDYRLASVPGRHNRRRSVLRRADRAGYHPDSRDRRFSGWCVGTSAVKSRHCAKSHRPCHSSRSCSAVARNRPDTLRGKLEDTGGG